MPPRDREQKRHQRQQEERNKPQPEPQREGGGDDSSAAEETSRKFLQQRPWELCHILIRLLKGEKATDIARLEPPDPYYQFPPGVKTPGGRTENFVFSGWVGAYVWFGLWGTVSDAALWRARVVEYLQRQRGVGHMGGEQCCPDPHHGMHLGAVGVARLAAHYFGHADVLKWTGIYYSDHLVIGEACADEKGEVRAPGLRNKFRPPNQELWSWLVRDARGVKQREPKDDPYFNGALAVRALRMGWLTGNGPNSRDDLGLDLVEARANCVLRYPMIVERTDRGYLARMDTGGKPVMQGTYWVCADGGEATYGYDINEPAPPPPGKVTKTINFERGRAAGSSEL